MNDPRGSLWRKWDLHVHTPASIVQQYGGNSETVWDRFFDNLESLPNEFKVIGINDYIFIDGYRHVLEAKRSGRLANIDLILPVIELRLGKFGGTTGPFSRVNYHIIFSDQVDPDIIQNQFLSALSSHYQLSPQYSHLENGWNAVPTRESLEDLGELIIASVPPEEQCRYGSSLSEGFNNLCFTLEGIEESLRRHYFRNKFLTAVGKTEWADVRWNDHTIAEKKNVINGVNLVFTSAESIGMFRDARNALVSGGVNARLLDCSDAHHFSDSIEKDRIGKCFTWIKADPTFEGLCQAFREYEERISVGDQPPKVQRVLANKTQYIRSLSISKREDSTLEEAWFSNDLTFNHDLVAIIGNKGNGKSALADIIAFLGNSDCQEFSFLNSEKFCHPRDNKAQHFEATLTWESGDNISRRLHDRVPADAVAKVRYIPQHFFETLCNEIEIGEDSRFSAELKDVIFSHIDDSSRLGFWTLDDLARYRAQEIHDRIQVLRNELSELNERIVRLEQQTTEEYRRELSEAIRDREHALEVHDVNVPNEVPKPESNSEISQVIDENRTKIEELAGVISSLTPYLAKLRKRESVVTKLTGKIENFERAYASFENDCVEELELLDLSIADLVQVHIDKALLDTARDSLRTEIEGIMLQIDPDTEGSLASCKYKLEAEITQLREILDEADRGYQNYLQEKEDWTADRAEIVGSPESLGSLEYYRHQLELSITVLPARIAELQGTRKRKVGEIHRELQRIRDVYADLYLPVQEAISSNDLIDQNAYSLTFSATIQESRFADRFLGYISQRARGTFYGRSQSAQRVRDILAEFDLNEESNTIAFVDKVIQCLLEDQRDDRQESLSIDDQLVGDVTRKELYDFLFSLEYLEPKYGLQLNGKDLRLLSPGERGILLLIFYLLVDRDDCPLIIDQPDENLDSESVVELLVPCIKAGKQRRQMFIITHNPNLAVVCDAEQIIRATIDKTSGNRVSYISGAIEAPHMNKMVVDVLEGTWPAFQNREHKYIPQSQVRTLGNQE